MGGSHVLQHFWPYVSRHHLGRKPWSSDRVRDRWLPAGHSACRGGNSAISRQTPSGAVSIHNTKPGGGPGPNPIGGVPGCGGIQVTTGTPIALLIENEDQRSKDYSEIKDKFRPGHADYTYFVKYGIRDYRGGGRSSARETAMRVAAGAVARKVLPQMTVRGALIQLGTQKIDRAKWDWDEVDRNPFFSPDRHAVSTVGRLSRRNSQKWLVLRSDRGNRG